MPNFVQEIAITILQDIINVVPYLELEGKKQLEIRDIIEKKLSISCNN